MDDDEQRAREIVERGDVYVRPAETLAEAASRRALLERTRAARQEIEQLFLDCEYWNEHVRQPHEALIDADPDGLLRKLADHYDRILKHDTH